MLACDESGSKGYADLTESSPGEFGIFAGLLVPSELLPKAEAKFDEIASRYKPATGKLHITDLQPAQMAAVRQEIINAILELQIPCLFDAVYVAGFHEVHRLGESLVERAKERRTSKIRMSANKAKPASLHQALFEGLYGKTLAFCIVRNVQQLRLEVRTDQVDKPIFESFEECSKTLFELGATVERVTGFDPENGEVVSGEIRVTHDLDPLPITLTELSFTMVTSTNGLILAADVLANSLHHHIRTKYVADTYGPLNIPDAVAGHHLFKALDHTNGWGSDDVSDTLYVHPRRAMK